MVEIQLNEKTEVIKFNNYVLFQYSKAIGAKTPSEAMAKISSLGKGGVTIEAMEAFCTLLFEMVKAGNKETTCTFEDCFEVINEHETIEKVMNLLVDGLPQPETLKEGKQKEAV